MKKKTQKTLQKNLEKKLLDQINDRDPDQPLSDLFLNFIKEAIVDYDSAEKEEL